MISKIKTSWLLMDQSLRVLASHKKLLIFPALTFFSLIFIVLFFIGGFLFQPTGHSYTDKAHWQAIQHKVFTPESIAEMNKPSAEGQTRRDVAFNKTGALFTAGIYFLSMFLATFFNVAFYREIMEAINGRPVGIAKGFAFALSHLKPIFMWSLFAGAVGYLIKTLEQRLGFVGKIIMRFIGLAWSVASVFVIPVIVCNEGSNPVTMLKTSAQALKKNWGESLVGFVGTQMLSFIIFLLSAMSFVAVGVAGVALNKPLFMVCAIFGWILFIVTYSYIAGVAMNIYQCVLYRYASTGMISAGYTRDMMDIAWKHKN